MPQFSRRDLLLATAASLSATFVGSGRSQAAYSPIPANPILFDDTPITDWQATMGKLTFNTLPPSYAGGSVYLDPAEIAALGYNPNRQWKANTPIPDILQLGDIQLTNVFGPQVYSLNQLGQMAYTTALGWTQQQVQQWLGGLKLSDFGLTKLQSVQNLLSAIPSLGAEFIDDVAPLKDLYNLYAGFNSDNIGQTIGMLVDLDPEFGAQVMDALDLSKYGLPSIPNLIKSPVGAFAKWAQGQISQIPGLGDVPWAKFAISTLLSGRLAKVDLVLGAKEGLKTVFKNTVTGTDNLGFNVECANQACSHVELQGDGFKGLRFIINPAQSLDGGFGILKAINGGKEGTGWEPFGTDGPKVGIVSVSEKTDSIAVGLFFYIDAWWFGSHLGRSPKFIGIPFFNARVRQWIPAPG